MFIPKKIKVGFKRNKSEVIDKGYPVPYNPDGKLTKEAGLKTWMGSNSNYKDLSNDPQTGFKIKNINISCFWYNKYSSRYSIIDIEDPRGFFVEVSVKNLPSLLNNSVYDPHNGFIDSLVYGWQSNCPQLVSTASAEYKKFKELSDLQSSKVYANTLVVGGTYKNVANQNFIYVGKMPWWEWDCEYYSISGPRKCFVRWIFYHEDTKDFMSIKSVPKKIKKEVSGIPHKQIDSIIDEYTRSIRFNKITKFVLKPNPNGRYIEYNDNIFEMINGSHDLAPKQYMSDCISYSNTKVSSSTKKRGDLMVSLENDSIIPWPYQR